MGQDWKRDLSDWYAKANSAAGRHVPLMVACTLVLAATTAVGVTFLCMAEVFAQLQGYRVQQAIANAPPFTPFEDQGQTRESSDKKQLFTPFE